MTYTFQPQFIKRDSAVPIRMIVCGWVVAIATILYRNPASNAVIAIMGLTLLAGGLVALTLSADRMWRMVLGATAGALATLLGYRFAIADRLWPARSNVREILDLDHFAAIVLGLAVLAIGLGGVLEAVRAQASPGASPVIVRAYLIALGMTIAAALCRVAGVSAGVMVLVLIACGLGLGALAWLRRERPLSDFRPQP